MTDLLKHRFLTLFGILTIIFWLSLIVYLPPIAKIPNVKEMLAEIDNSFKVDVLNMNEQNHIIEERALWSINIQYIKDIIMIFLGVGGGVLIIMRRNTGRIIALCLCSYAIIIKILSIFNRYPNYYQSMKLFYDNYPVHVIHLDIVSSIYFIVTITYLLNRSVTEEFRHLTTG